MKRFLVLLLLAACGSPKREAHEVTSPAQELRDAAQSVRERLLRCDSGLPGKPSCYSMEKQADSLGMAGYYRLAFGDAEIDRAVQSSIDPDGRPWRGPEFRRLRNGDFSRDHVISLAQWALGARDKDLLPKVIRYAQLHDWRVCPADRCILTPGLINVVRDVVVFNGGVPPSGTNIAQTIHEHQIAIEAIDCSRADLILDKILLKAWTKNLTKVYADAANKCANKVPLYGEYVRLVTHGGNADKLVADLTATLKAWKGPTAGGHWTADGTGWSLVALAKLLDSALVGAGDAHFLNAIGGHGGVFAFVQPVSDF